MHLLTYERQAHRTKDDRKMQYEILNNELVMSYLKRFTYELNIGLYEGCVGSKCCALSFEGACGDD